MLNSQLIDSLGREISMSEPYLYFDHWSRGYAVNLCQVYVCQFEKRLLPTFDDIDDEANAASGEFYSAGIASISEDGDPSSLASDAFEHGLKVWEELDFVRSQLVALAATGLFHLWERLTKRFIAVDLRRRGFEATPPISRWTFDDTMSCLTKMGWDVRREPFFPDLERLQLLANAVKHGHGPSRDRLAARWPEVLRDHATQPSSFVHLEWDDPQVTPDHFNQVASAVMAFWSSFPESLPLRQSERGGSSA